MGSLAKGSWMFGWLGQLPDGQEISMGWAQPRVSAQSTLWIDTAECWGVVW